MGVSWWPFLAGVAVGFLLVFMINELMREISRENEDSDE